tara:strand:+ start:1108 stop:1251 length:144 start_codon:yes stop_codon:yes gene_type:complete
MAVFRVEDGFSELAIEKAAKSTHDLFMVANERACITATRAFFFDQPT